MFSPGFRLPGTNTDAAARELVQEMRMVREVPGLRRYSYLARKSTETLHAQLVNNSRLNVHAIAEDRDLIVSEAIEAAKDEALGGGLDRLNEFWIGRKSSRLPLGTTTDPHALQFITEHSLTKHAEAFAAEPIDALTKLSEDWGPPVDLHRPLEKLREEYDSSSQISSADRGNMEARLKSADAHRAYMPRLCHDTREALIRVSVARFHALGKMAVPVFLREAEGARAKLALEERAAQEKVYRKNGISGDALKKQLETYDSDVNEALRNMQITDAAHATSAQLVETVSKSLKMTSEQLSTALHRIADASSSQARAATETNRILSDASSSHARAAKETNRILSNIYDAVTKEYPRKGNSTSSRIQDTYQVVKSIEGGERILEGAVQLFNQLL